MDVTLTKAWKNHPKGTVLRSVNQRLKDVLIENGVVAGPKARRKPPYHKMVTAAPTAKRKARQ